jgi:hypothetical protein
VSKEYLWSKRETTKEGAPLMELVELGISRVKYASECVIALMKEIKEHSTQGRYFHLVFSFFTPLTSECYQEAIFVHSPIP